MKSNILLFFFLVICGWSQAQDITLDPGVFKIDMTSEEDKKFGFVLANDTDTTFNWFWSVELPSDFPSEWEVQVCDQELCYNFGVLKNSNNKVNVLPAGQRTSAENQYVRIRANGVPGESYVIFNVYSQPDCEGLIVKSLEPSVSTEELDFSDTRIYPNPAQDYFQITKDERVAAIELYNIVGKKVNTLSHQKGQSHNISSLQSGLYIVRMLDEKGQMLKSQRLQKR